MTLEEVGRKLTLRMWVEFRAATKLLDRDVGAPPTRSLFCTVSGIELDELPNMLPKIRRNRTGNMKLKKSPLLLLSQFLVIALKTTVVLNLPLRYQIS